MLLRVFEKIVFSEQSNGGITLTGKLSELAQMRESNPLRGKVFNQARVKESVSGIGDDLSVNVLCLDLYIDRKLQDCLHLFLVELFNIHFRPSGTHQGCELSNRMPRLFSPGMLKENNFIHGLYHSLAIG